MEVHKILKMTQDRIDMEELYFCFFSDLGLDQQGEVAQIISNLSKTDDTVLDVEPDEVFDREMIALLFETETNRLVAFVALMKPFKNEVFLRMAEVGTMFTLPEFQRQGLATFLVHKINEEAARREHIDGVYAFLNTKSPTPFALCGYAAATEDAPFVNGRVLFADLLPKEAIDLCRNLCQSERLAYRDSILAGQKPIEEKDLEIEKYFKDRKEEFLDLADGVISKYYDVSGAKVEIKSEYRDDSMPEDEQIAQINEICRRHMDFYYDNTNNNLLCCNLVVGQIF